MIQETQAFHVFIHLKIVRIILIWTSSLFFMTFSKITIFPLYLSMESPQTFPKTTSCLNTAFRPVQITSLPWTGIWNPKKLTRNRFLFKKTLLLSLGPKSERAFFLWLSNLLKRPLKAGCTFLPRSKKSPSALSPWFPHSFETFIILFYFLRLFNNLTTAEHRLVVSQDGFYYIRVM